MNRRVLLVDADIEFRDTLTQALRRYGVVVMTEHDAERDLKSKISNLKYKIKR